MSILHSIPPALGLKMREYQQLLSSRDATALAINRASMDNLANQFPVDEQEVKQELKTFHNLTAYILSPSTVPTENPPRILYFLHGGGFCTGSYHSYRHFLYILVKTFQCSIFFLNYHLSPECDQRQMDEEIVEGYHYVRETMGYRTEEIGIIGDSAGGFLCTRLLLLLKAAATAAGDSSGAPLPAFTILQSPWLDLSLSAPSLKSHAEADYTLSEELLDWFRSLYIPKIPSLSTEEQKQHWYSTISPVFSQELSSLGPIFLQCGSEEILLDDSIRFIQNHSKQDHSHATIAFHLYPGGVHDFHLVLPYSNTSQLAMKDLWHFIGRYWKDIPPFTGISVPKAMTGGTTAAAAGGKTEESVRNSHL